MPNQRTRGHKNKGQRPISGQNHGGIVGRLIVMFAVVAAVVLGVAIFFRVHQVDVTGNKIYSADQIRQVCGVEEGDNLLMLNRTGIAGRVYASLPYVQEVSVGRIAPDTVVIAVKESQIIGKVKSDVGADWYVNTDGRVLGRDTEGYDGRVVELQGFTITAPAAGTDAVASEGMEEEMAAALGVLKQMEGTGLIEITTLIDTQKSFDIKIVCGERYEILLGGDDELEYKIRCVLEVMDHLEPHDTGVIDFTKGAEDEIHFTPWK